METSDSFGRLPNDVINQIMSLYQHPTLELIEMRNVRYDSKLIIKSSHTTFEFEVPLPLYHHRNSVKCEKKKLDLLQNLIKNKKGFYECEMDNDMDDVFNISICDNITIVIGRSKIIFSLDALDNVIFLLEKMYQISDKYEKF